MTLRFVVLLAVATALTACAGAPPTEFRVSAARISPNAGAAELIALGKGQLGLGNVALALESFRKAARLDPNSVEALGGIAIAYERMGRFDLSRRYYEAALAVAPNDPELLARLAATLDAGGEGGLASRVRSELAALSGRSVVVPARPESQKKAGSEPAPAIRQSPRLVRLSAAEVALVSGRASVWEAPRPPLLAPVKQALRAGGPRIALLNAARVARLAARTKAYLEGQGWNGIAIGDSAVARSTSVIFYPASQRQEAELLSTKFGIVRLLDPAATRITVLLGRDHAVGAMTAVRS